MRKTIWRNPAALVFAALVLTGCAGLNRSCTTAGAGTFGADWIIVQYDMSGEPFNCWKLKGVSVANEGSSDGIYWASGTLGHLVHVGGWYNRVQVTNSDYDGAAALVGVDAFQCGNGRYPVTRAADPSQ